MSSPRFSFFFLHWIWESARFITRHSSYYKLVKHTPIQVYQTCFSLSWLKACLVRVVFPRPPIPVMENHLNVIIYLIIFSEVGKVKEGILQITRQLFKVQRQYTAKWIVVVVIGSSNTAWSGYTFLPVLRLSHLRSEWHLRTCKNIDSSVSNVTQSIMSLICNFIILLSPVLCGNICLIRSQSSSFHLLSKITTDLNVFNN